MSRKQHKQRKLRTPRSRKSRPGQRLPFRQGRAESGREDAPDSGLKRRSRLLTKVDKDPEAALEDPRCSKPHFLAELFDLCDGKVLEAAYVAPDYTEVAVELARRTGDCHQMNLAAGVHVHAAIGNEQWDAAAERLEAYRQQAFDCCRVCTSDWLKRQGDLLTETEDPAQAQVFLDRAAQVLGDDLDDDTRGRILFVRGIAQFLLLRRSRALADAGTALRLLSLSSPHGYFLDTVAFIACFLVGKCEERHHETALAHLDRFRERLKGQKGWDEVRDRLRWVEAQVHARLGHPRRARMRLQRARAAHFKYAPHRWVLAIALDEALVFCRHRSDAGSHSVQQIIKDCKNQLKLEKELRRHLLQAATMLGKRPYRAREILVALRRSFFVPVPGLLAR